MCVLVFGINMNSNYFDKNPNIESYVILIMYILKVFAVDL